MTRAIITRCKLAKSNQITVKEITSQIQRENTHDLTREVQESKLNGTKLNCVSYISESPMKMNPKSNERECSSSIRKSPPPLESKVSFEVYTNKTMNEKPLNLLTNEDHNQIKKVNEKKHEKPS